MQTEQEAFLFLIYRKCKGKSATERSEKTGSEDCNFTIIFVSTTLTSFKSLDISLLSQGPSNFFESNYTKCVCVCVCVHSDVGFITRLEPTYKLHHLFRQIFDV